MNIYITLDYELFLGSRTGDIQHCLITPMNELSAMVDKYGIKLVLFVDAAYLYRLNELRNSSTRLNEDYLAVCQELKKYNSQGHDIEMHFHPQWIYSDFINDEWRVDLEHYKLSDMDEDLLKKSFIESKKLLDSIIGRKTIAFRAGGYSIQTLMHYSDFLISNGIRFDSSAVRGTFCDSKYQKYDYRTLPYNNVYFFSEDITIEDTNGNLQEYVISTKTYSFLRYLPLRFFTKIGSKKMKRFGNGCSLSAKKKNGLFNERTLLASIDGANVYFLDSIYRQEKKLGKNNLIIIGHPKNLSNESICLLERFIKRNNHDCFLTFLPKPETNREVSYE